MPTPHDGMTLVFSDNFTYSGSPPVDPAKWFMGDPRPGNVGYGDAKMLLASDPNINTVLTGGGGSDLSINATYDTAYNATYATDWITAQLSTAWNDGTGHIAGVGVRRGYFEIEMTIPFDPNAQGRVGGTGTGSGTWAAFWFEQFATILGTGPTAELDIEIFGVGNNQFPATSQWWPLPSTGPTDAMGNTSHWFWTKQVGGTAGFPTLADFQGTRTTFGVLIDDYNVTWFVNGVLQCVIPLLMPENQDPFFAMVVLEMGGGWPIVNPPAAPNNQYSLLVHSVNIWKADPMTTITGVGSVTVTPVSSTQMTINYTISGLPSPTFSPASSPTTTGSSVSLGTLTPGTSGDTLSVSLTSDSVFPSGSSLTLSGSSVLYTPGTITSGTAGSDTIVFHVTESNGASASFTTSVTLVAMTSGTGNGLVIKNFTRATDLTHFNTAMAAVVAGTAGARCIVVCTGDSTTGGVTAIPAPTAGVPYPDQLASALGTIKGVPHNYSSFYGDQQSFQYITFTGTAVWNFGLAGPGSGMLGLNAVNDTAVWAPTDSRLTGTFDRIDVTYWDIGAGTIAVTVGTLAPVTLTFGTSGDMKTVTLTLPSAVTNPASVTFKLATATAGYGVVAGAALWSHATPAIEVRNVGVGGATAVLLTPATLSSANQVIGIETLNPNLIIMNFGINDINSSGNGGAETLAQMGTNLSTAIGVFKAPGGSFTNSDVMLVLPHPFVASTSPTPTFTQASMETALATMAVTAGIPIASLYDTYGQNGSAFQSSSLTTPNGSGPHPNATGYGDIALRIASLLTNVSQTYASAGLPAAVIPSGWAID